MKEYAIWGIPPTHKTEQLLLTKIISYSEAKRHTKTLQTKYNCKECRIQTIKFSDNINQSFINGLTI